MKVTVKIICQWNTTKQKSSVIAMQILNLPMLLSSKASNTVCYDSIMLKSAFKVYMGPKCQSVSFFPLYINQKIMIILVLIMLKDAEFKMFTLVFWYPITFEHV